MRISQNHNMEYHLMLRKLCISRRWQVEAHKIKPTHPTTHAVSQLVILLQLQRSPVEPIDLEVTEVPEEMRITGTPEVSMRYGSPMSLSQLVGCVIGDLLPFFVDIIAGMSGKCEN